MKIQFKNLGPLKSGEIDISKRVNLFVGYNNSGKTYASLLLWSLFDYETKPFEFKKNELNFNFEFVGNPIEIEITSAIAESATDEYISQIIKTSVPSTFNVTANDEIVKRLKIDFNEDALDAIKSFKDRHMFFTMSNERDIKAYSLQKEANSCIIKFNQENPKGINNANFNFNDFNLDTIGGRDPIIQY